VDEHSPVIDDRRRFVRAKQSVLIVHASDRFLMLLDVICFSG